jgi:hypothetical protein
MSGFFLEKIEENERFGNVVRRNLDVAGPEKGMSRRRYYRFITMG